MVREEKNNRVAVFFAVSVAAVTLLAAVVLLSQNSDSSSELLATKAVEKTAVAPHKKAAAPNKFSAVFPAKLMAAEKKEEAEEKAQKERVLAQAAKSALKEYSTLQQKAKVELQQQSAHVRTLVSSAARELIAEETMDKQKEAAKTKPDGWGTGASKKNHDSAARKWRARMKEAERAALDVIQREDKVSADSSLAWKAYALKQKEHIEKMKKNEALLEKKQDKHIAQLVASGQLRGSSNKHKKAVHKVAIHTEKPMAKKSLVEKKKAAAPPKAASPKRVVVHAKKVVAKKVAPKKKVAPVSKSVKAAVTKAMKAVKANPSAIHNAKSAAAHVMKEMKDSRKVRFIAKKQLPLLEQHLKDQEKSMEGRKSWHSLQRNAKVAETKRAKAWLKLMRQVRSEEKTKEKAEAAKVALEKKHLAYISKMIQSGTQKHLERQVENIVGDKKHKKAAAAGAKIAAPSAKNHIEERKIAAKAKIELHHAIKGAAKKAVFAKIEQKKELKKPAPAHH